MATNVNGIQHQFNPDDLVEALDPHSRAWRLAWIERLDPYLGSPGYRVRYADATEQWHCHSGHQMEATVRGVKFCEARTRTWDGMTQHNRLQHSMRGVPFAAICISCDNCDAPCGVLCMKAADPPEPPVPSEAILRTARDAAEKMIDDGRAMVERGQAALREVAHEELRARERAALPRCAGRWNTNKCALPAGHHGYHETEGGFTRWPDSADTRETIDEGLVDRFIADFHARRACSVCSADASKHDTQPPHACAETKCQGFGWGP